MDKLDYLGIGNRIRKQRELLGYSREKMAEYLGVSTKFCSDIELGLKGMSLHTLCKISQLFHVSTDYILFGSREEPANSELIEAFRHIPTEKVQYAEEILKAYIKAIM